jgi:transcription elongation factor GreB
MLMAGKLLARGPHFRDRLHTIPGPGRDTAENMTRYRKPNVPGSRYATPDGARRLREELDELWRVQRPAVTKAVQEAAAQGDRSENAEYIYGKKQLREIDRRVRFLRKRLEGLVVVSRPPDDRSRIFFGAWVRVEDDAGQETEFRIVGPDEIDPARRYVSMDAPLARLLMGKRLDDEVTIEAPGGTRTYVVVAIRYEEADSG